MRYEQPLVDRRKERFCQIYAKTMDAANSAKKAGYKGAARSAFNLMKNREVLRRIDELVKRSDQQYDFIKHKLVNEMAAIAFSDMQEMYDLSKMSLEKVKKIDGRLINSIKKNHDGTFNVKLHDKIKAADWLAKCLGMYQEKYDVTSGGTPLNIVVNKGEVADALKKAAQRLDGND